MNYERARRRGLQRVGCEIMLICLGRNIRKFFVLIDSKNIRSIYWVKPENLKAEMIPFPKQKKTE